MDLNTQLRLRRDEYRIIVERLQEEPNHDQINSTIISLRRDIANYNRSCASLSCALKKCTQATVGILTGYLRRLQSSQVRGAGASSTVDVSNDTTTGNYIEWQDLENVFKNRMKTSIIINLKHKDVKAFLSDAKEMLISQLALILQDKNALKVNTVLALNYEIEKPSDNSVEVETKYFSEGSFEVLQSSDLNQLFKENFDHFIEDVEEAELNGSGWKLHEILHLEIQINDYIPLQGGNSSFVEMPSWILKTHSVVNVKNSDNFCFIWSVLSCLYKASNHVDRVSQYKKHVDKLNCSGITSPITWEKIKFFEKQNALKINIYGIENDDDDDDESTFG